MDAELFTQSYHAFVSRLQDAGFDLRSSRLDDDHWVVVVNPRPLLIVRTRYNGHDRSLIVEARRPFRWRERLKATLEPGRVDALVADAVQAHRAEVAR